MGHLQFVPKIPQLFICPDLLLHTIMHNTFNTKHHSGLCAKLGLSMSKHREGLSLHNSFTKIFICKRLYGKDASFFIFVQLNPRSFWVDHKRNEGSTSAKQRFYLSIFSEIAARSCNATTILVSALDFTNANGEKEWYSQMIERSSVRAQLL